LNGEPINHRCKAHRSLLEVLRDEIGLTGTKHGCDLGDCGACTVLVNGEPRLSCITVAAEVDGTDVKTIEGLATHGLLHPVQQAMHKHVAAQCGYCTPGIALCLASLLERETTPDESMLREALASNICRCTGYTKILSAAQEVIEARRREGTE
jgi:aerobic-type carbon monoxide dehydrogenase small subunit (CoxS/CutS family)